MGHFNLDGRIDRIVHFRGKEYLYFSGTSYLGMGMEPEFIKSFQEGVKKFGLSHGQSRLNNVRLSVYYKFEEYFAKQAGAPATTVMSSGYLAGKAALEILRKVADEIWVAPDTHPAILPSSLSPNPRESFREWKSSCLEKSSKLEPQRILILGNAVNPLNSDIHDYDWVGEICSRHEVTLLVDDSHAFGVIGEGVFGTYNSLSSLPARVLVSASLGKGLGLPAGIVLSDESTKEEIIRLPVFVGASPCPPAYLHAFLNSQELYLNRKEKLIENIQHFFTGSEGMNLLGHNRYPVFRFNEDEWVEQLENSGFITSSFSYPRPNDPKINRIVISAFHTSDDINRLISQLSKFQ